MLWLCYHDNNVVNKKTKGLFRGLQCHLITFYYLIKEISEDIYIYLIETHHVKNIMKGISKLIIYYPDIIMPL